ncbi:WYL domain-containing protein [Bacillus cereus group sp. MYBK77-1]|uniref:WYL domain-containing protein n=1 Tax=Bacillus TaxID=1386 RepID=UPI002B4BD779|nr:MULTISPECIES: WYL domain-containing protein [Bacillus cereus group]
MYCLEKETIRLFKLKRMKEVVINRERIFIRRDATIQEHIKSESKSKPSNVPAVLLRFQDEARHLAEEWFDI